MTKASNKPSYLTKDVLNRAADKGVKQASEQAMDTAGSVVIAKGKWVVRRYKDGSFSKITELETVPNATIKKKLAKLAGD
jgi:hypothetical protein